MFIVIRFLLKLNTPRTLVLTGLKAVYWLGSMSVVASTVMVLLGIEFGGVDHPWKSLIVICLIVFGFMTALLFVLI